MKRNKKFTVAVLILFLIEICRLCPSLAVWQKPESLPSSSSSEMPVSNNSAFIPAGFSTSVEEENINMEKKTINQDKTDSKTTTSNKDSEYLKPTKFAESDNQKIIDLANQITKDCTTDEEKAQKIFDYIHENYTYKFYYRTAAGALKMLDKKEGNGPDISHLFVALCRAVGIEARYKRALVTNASGMGDGIPDTVERIYAQVKIDGKWLDADPADKRNTKIGQLTIKIQEDRETYSEYKNENTTGVTLADRDTTSSQESSSTVSNFNNSYPPEMQQYLLPVNSTAIQAKANELILGKTTDYEKAKAIYDWVNNNKGYAFYYNTSKGAEGMLNASSGNCCDLAHLLVALFRAAGLPARYKHNTACTFSSGTYGHVWPQVYVDGKWIDADTSSLTDSFGNVAFTANHDNDKVYAILPF